MFIDRAEEIEALNKAYARRPTLVVVYGRRRVGKTRLILEWARKKGLNTIYYHALPAGHDVNLQGISRSISESLGAGFFEKARFTGLDSILEALAGIKRDAVIVIDEFTYWVRGEPRVAGELQRFTDHVLPKTDMMIVIVGSLLGVMLRGILGAGAPLYGRSSIRLRVDPIKPWETGGFHPWLSPEDQLRVYGLFGGIPYYHSMIEEGEGIRGIIERLVASPHTPLRDELIFILRDELQNPAPYYSVLEALARGYTRISEVSSYTGIHVQHLPRYISTLELLGLVERVTPLGSKRGWYRIKDPIARTWFRLVEPVLPLIEAGSTGEAAERVRRGLEELMGEVFEEAAVEYVKHLARAGEIRYDELGKWSRKGVEIDILAVDNRGRTVHAFEVKWSTITPPEARRIAAKLEAKLMETSYRDWMHEVHIICRSYSGEKPRHIKIHTIDDMPFQVKKAGNTAEPASPEPAGKNGG